jgi:hypothetical protein
MDMRLQMASTGSELPWNHELGPLKHFKVPNAALLVAEVVYMDLRPALHAPALTLARPYTYTYPELVQPSKQKDAGCF